MSFCVAARHGQHSSPGVASSDGNPAIASSAVAQGFSEVRAVIQFSREMCGNLHEATRREWLEANGIGGFASSSIAGLNTRRYHGLLVSATRPPVGRMVLLSKLEEVVWIAGERFELSANQYPSVIHPTGYRYLAGFRLDPFPIFTYDLKDTALEKTIFLIHGENTAVIIYRLLAGGPVTLEVRPLIAFRDYHSTTHENAALDPFVANESGAAMVQPYAGLPPLWLGHNGSVKPDGCWYRNFEYVLEQERGLDYLEDLFSPMVLSFETTPNRAAVIVASTERHNADDADQYERKERERREKLGAGENEALVRQLSIAADQFIVSRGAHKTIIAGYHWFSDWGRDAMVSLPGLTLATGRPEIARSILLEFATHVNQGMLPNRFPDAEEPPEYNTVDATLWFFEAIRKYVEYTEDLELIRTDLFPVLTDIMQWHFRGTRHGIHAGEDGLLWCGVPGVQLTWMDAKIGDLVVTPRQGKPVEIQALWYNALRIMERFASELGYRSESHEYADRAVVAAESFHRQFWNQAVGCLYDVVDGDERDCSIRPNQILAVSLPHALVSPEREASIVAVVERELWTSWGLRTLNRSDPRYCATYGGDARARDSAYHQGTVWPWLMGPFITAYVKVNRSNGEALQKARRWVEKFQLHLQEAGLGQVSEVFSAEPPHAPGGCIAQAWSVAELLRTLKEDLGSAGRKTFRAAPSRAA